MKPIVLPLGTLFLAISFTGCVNSWVSDEPIVETDPPVAEATISDERLTPVVADYARGFGMDFKKVNSIALVTGLDGTGSDPPPSMERTELLNVMSTHEVKEPANLLASPNTSLVLVEAYLPPGMQKGDRFDVQIRVPMRSSTKNLSNGWLMETRLQELAMLGNQLHRGHVTALSQGSVIVDSLIDGEGDEISNIRGRILGGGKAVKSRPLGIVIYSRYQSVATSTRVGKAINQRFHTFDHGKKRGVANPKTDEFIELAVHPRYRHNLVRYMRVIAALPMNETPRQQVERLEVLRRQLLEGITAGSAALSLEAIGSAAIPVLQEGLNSSDPEVIFHAAEALAYLEDETAAAPLGEIARTQSAFRWHALAALGAMNSPEATDELAKLLVVQSAETRYGAFRTLHAMNPRNPLIAGERLNGVASLHTVDDGQPMVHLSRRKRPEIVLFGGPQPLATPLVLFVGKEISVKTQGDRLKVSRFSARKDDQELFCEPNLAALLATLTKVGAEYPQLLTVIQQAHRQEYLPARVVADAIPHNRRRYIRDADDAIPMSQPSTARPTLFNFRGDDEGEDVEESALGRENSDTPEENGRPWWDVLDMMGG